MTSFNFDIPTIETERLILRAPLESDLDALEDFNQSERSHLIGGPLDRANCWRVISNGIRSLGAARFWHVAHSP